MSLAIANLLSAVLEAIDDAITYREQVVGGYACIDCGIGACTDHQNDLELARKYREARDLLTGQPSLAVKARVA